MSGVQGQNRMTICPIQGDIKTIVRSFFFCMSSSSSPPPLPAGGDISAVSLLERQAHDEHLPPGAATRWQSCLLVEGQSGPPQHAGRLSVCALPVLALGLGHLGRHKFCIKKTTTIFTLYVQFHIKMHVLFKTHLDILNIQIPRFRPLVE